MLLSACDEVAACSEAYQDPRGLPNISGCIPTVAMPACYMAGMHGRRQPFAERNQGHAGSPKTVPSSPWSCQL